jgi:TPP-dependent pyruvate/acetoin dehydrogenase alpha subunit
MGSVMSTSVERRLLLSDAVEQYRRMREIRELEERIVGLFSEGLVHGTTHTCQGQEALAVGIAASLNPDDTVSCTYRGHGIALALGLTPDSVLGEIMGRTTGCIGGLGGSMHLSDPDVGLMPTFAIVGAGIPIGAGAALAFQTRGESRVSVGVFGDGATNIGAFHEGLNLAAIWSLPVVFVCDNNVYAEYSRIDRTTRVTDLSTRAAGYGMPAESIDGMDMDAVLGAMARAVDLARTGGGPTLIEARTYRYAGHSRADLAEYRPVGELESWLDRDPVKVRREQLISMGLLSAESARELDAGVAAEIDAAVERTRSAPHPTAAAMFDNVWTERRMQVPNG